MRPLQAQALHEAAQCRGLLAPIGVGCGKTLIALLLALVLGAVRPVILVAPKLKDQFLRNAKAYASDWRIPPFQVVTYSALSQARTANILESLHPDLLIADEAHHLKRIQAARTKRFIRYFRTHPETVFCGLSGTITSKSIKDYAHLARLALGAGSPVPRLWKVLDDWSLALDPDPLIEPGALSVLGEPVREGYRKRLVETPGVVASSKADILTSLNFYERRTRAPKAIKESLTALRATWCTPGGEEFSTALDLTRHAKELAQGFYYRWLWPEDAPNELIERWRQARANWHRELRGILKGNRPGLDSPLLVENAIRAGRLKASTYGPWTAVRDLVEPKTDAVWIDDWLIRDAVAWAKKDIGIVWYEDLAVEAKLRKYLPVYGRGTDAELATGKESIACSVAAQGEGRNLQFKFHRNLVLSPSTNGAWWEQLVGRTHRQGQAEDEVEFYVYQHTPEFKEAIPRAVEDARYAKETLGAAPKLLLGTFTFTHIYP